MLEYDDEGAFISDGKMKLRGDFSSLSKRIKHNNLSHELVVKAVKIKSMKRPLRVLDATAGMGEDSFLLAAAGNEVLLFEQDPVIFGLLKDALERAGKDPELKPVTDRMRVFGENSIPAMLSGEYGPDVILLDPMFPRREKSGLIKKKFQLLHLLERPCENEKELLDAALSSGAVKVVIKRPAKGPLLGGVKPDYTLEGKAIRYDCIMVNEKRSS